VQQLPAASRKLPAMIPSLMIHIFVGSGYPASHIGYPVQLKNEKVQDGVFNYLANFSKYILLKP
jgi:hypothetical protein